MNIEFRWFKERMTRETMRRDGLIGTAYDYGGYHDKKLQYRICDDMVWSDWVDVLVVLGE